MSRDLIVALVGGGIPLVLAGLVYRWFRGPFTHTGLSATPDRPLPFGYKSGWLAVRATSTDEIVDALAPRRRTPCNWAAGFDRVYGSIGRDDLFVTPPVDGWVFVVGTTLDDEQQLTTVGQLSRVLGREVFGFASHRVVSFAAWAHAVDGAIVRAWGIADGQRLYDVGAVTEAERALDISFDEDPAEDDDERWSRQSDEATVIALAATWTRDPTTLDAVETLGVGTLITLRRGAGGRTP